MCMSRSVPAIAAGTVLSVYSCILLDHVIQNSFTLSAVGSTITAPQQLIILFFSYMVALVSIDT